MFKIIEENTGKTIFENLDVTICLEWLKKYANEDENKWSNSWLALEKQDKLSSVEEPILWLYLEQKVRSKHGVGSDYVLNRTNVKSKQAQQLNSIKYELVNFKTNKEFKGMIPLYKLFA